jgi:REP element-mobilizing transposase RayT
VTLANPERQRRGGRLQRTPSLTLRVRLGAEVAVNRYWFFTWRTYATWLPGQPGFVGQYVTAAGHRVIDNVPGLPTAEPMPRLADYARDRSLAPAVYLSAQEAGVIRAQLLETAAFRGRQIDALAVMDNHVHLVFGVTGDPDHKKMLADWKAYASRSLNRLHGRANPERQRRGARQRSERRMWWAEGGSTRKLESADNRCAAIRYVLEQENPLLVWFSDEAQQLLGESVA